MFAIDDYDYILPPDRVAQFPVARKDASRLMKLDRGVDRISHHRFSDLPDLLAPGDVLVVNNTEVVPARIMGKKTTGGGVEALVLDYPGTKDNEGTVCQCLVKASKRLLPGMRLMFEDTLPAEVLSGQEGKYRLRFDGDIDFDRFLQQKGRLPLPPYIHRDDGEPPCDDGVSYQTVYAENKGAVAAPTAGLHFTVELLGKIQEKGVVVAPLTLHVGIGTFLPVRVNDIRNHRMHSERFYLTQETAAAVNRAKTTGGRVVAVGTTVVRVLEYLYNKKGGISAAEGQSDLFIYPGFDFQAVDALITNFHLPRSTLLMLVAAFAGRERILDAYETAVREKYRFYSYGDAMFIV